MCNLLCFCWGKKEEKTEKQRLTKKKPESSIGYHFSERVFLSPPKTQSVKTVRLSENSFEHDFSDFSDPERKISYARRLCRQEEGEILQEFIPREVKETSNVHHVKADVHHVPRHVIVMDIKEQKR